MCPHCEDLVLFILSFSVQMKFSNAADREEDRNANGRRIEECKYNGVYDE